MSLVAFTVKLERIDEGLLHQDPGGNFWLSGVCTLDQDAKGRMIVTQSIPKERYAAGERGPAIGTWRHISQSKPGPVCPGKPAFDLTKYKKPPAQTSRLSRAHTRKDRSPPSHCRRPLSTRRKTPSKGLSPLSRPTSINPDFDMYTPDSPNGSISRPGIPEDKLHTHGICHVGEREAEILTGYRKSGFAIPYHAASGERLIVNEENFHRLRPDDPPNYEEVYGR